MADSNQDSLIAQLVDIAHVQPNEARQYLESSNWDLTSALELVYGQSNLDSNEDEEVQPSPAPAHASASPASSSQSAPQRRAAPARRFATLRDVTQGEEDDHHGGHSDSDDENIPQDMFAGGEKSGLAVQNPDDLKKKIIEQAKRSIASEQQQKSTKKSNFTGSARTLGGDDAPSRIINPDPSTAAGEKKPAHVHRVLNFWSNGFSVDDGELYDTSNPLNAEILNQIRHGRAPLSIMNVDQNQEVDVEIVQHAGEYVAPKKKFKPFSGAGYRLGSPTPGVAGVTTSTTAAPAAEKKAEPSAAERAAPQVDESQPVLTLQIRLGDGSRTIGRFNATHTVGDVYTFVAATNAGSQGREWVLMTTFPSKELKDKSVALGDLEGYKRGGVLVQKWA